MCVSPTEYEHPNFTVDLCDHDGDAYSEGIFLHYGDTVIKVADTLNGFKAHAEHLLGMIQELKELGVE
jgi:hypothetical protein